MKFKVGDRVKVLECPRLKIWLNWKNAVGKVGTISGDAYEENTGTYIVDFNEKNEFSINFPEESLQLITKTPEKIICEFCGK